jgi:acetoin:2,6-dichlorophenolindophenol oxidoreductase subunit alpha
MNEETVVDLVNKNEIGGVTHEYIGQEAVAVGVCGALRADDVITSTHRGHGHVIAKGGDVGRMFAELMGREAGMNRGRGGSMHIADVGLGIYGANGIVAAGAPIAAGAAFASVYQGADRVAITFFGDGGANQGVLFETLNLAALWRLPLIFVCENNGYAVSVALRHATAVDSIAARASAFGMESTTVDGMDCRAVREATSAAVERARSGGGPSFIECVTYRFAGHHTAERLMKLDYRTEGEITRWMARDPLEVERKRLLALGEAAEGQVHKTDSEIEAQLIHAVEWARKQEMPAPSTATDYMYASGLVPVGGAPA